MLRLDAVYASRSAAAPDGFEECINFWYRECGLPAELRSQLHSLRIWANAARHHDAARWRRDWPRRGEVAARGGDDGGDRGVRGVILVYEVRDSSRTTELGKTRTHVTKERVPKWPPP